MGRNYAYQIVSDVALFFEDKDFNRFMGAGALGTVVDEFGGDNFDHAGLGFVGGGLPGRQQLGSRPIGAHPVPPGTPRWGSGWKRAVARSLQPLLRISTHGGCQSYRGNYLDLDPTYRDVHGQPCCA